MLKFGPYVFRSMRQNLIRTGLTVLGVGLAAFIVVYLLAVFDSRGRAAAASADTLLIVQQKDVY